MTEEGHVTVPFKVGQHCEPLKLQGLWHAMACSHACASLRTAPIRTAGHFAVQDAARHSGLAKTHDMSLCPAAVVVKGGRLVVPPFSK